MSLAFDLKRIRDELAAAPLPSPYPLDLAAAVVDDCFRLAGRLPLPWKDFKEWTSKKAKRRLLAEQLGMLAHVLAVTSLRDQTVATLAVHPELDAGKVLDGFFDAIAPLTAEMIRANAFRQEEFLRRWIAAVGGTVEGEAPEASNRRLDQLDYRKTLKEYTRAEDARKAEAEKRARLLREAAEREAAARGWRE